MKIAVFPGSFDPVTLGHMDMIKRASKLFDKVIVTVMQNSDKQYVFSEDERVEMLKLAVDGMENVEVEAYSGLLVDWAEEKGACAIVKGMRTAADFEWEMTMALINKKMGNGIETILLTTDEEYMYLSSSVVREFAKYGRSVKGMVPEKTVEKIESKFYERRK